MDKRNVGIFVFPNIELLDFAGPYEVFSVSKDSDEKPLFQTFLIGKDKETFRSVNGLQCIPDFSIDEHPNLDILIIPGGIGTKDMMLDVKIVHWIKSQYPQLTYLLSVCTGARILSQTGLLDNIEYTTHHDCFAELEDLCPKGRLNKEIRFTTEGKILTSGGISAGIDLSLYMVERFFGNDSKRRTMEYMEYGKWRS